MKISRRTNLWFDQFDWSIKLYLPEAFVLRNLDHTRIDHIIERRREWARTIVRSQPGSWFGNQWKKIRITDTQGQDLHSFCEFLLDDARPRKMTITGDWIYIYTTDISLITDIKSLGFIDQSLVSVRCVQQVGEPNTVRVKHPRHIYRSYCRDMPLGAAQRENLGKWLAAQSGIRMSPSLETALARTATKRIFSYYFIDHDEHGSLMMLDLIVPNLIRRTLPIVADK